MNIDPIGDKACEIIVKVGEFIRRESAKIGQIVIEEKDLNSLVSYVDKEAEKQLVEGLDKLLPGCGFLTEEETEDTEGDGYQWIIDPLDGTTNFLYGIPTYSVSVALRQADELVIGIIYEINRDELFYAVKGKGAYLNNKAIQVSQRDSLAKSLLATGFPYYDFSNMQGYLKALQYFIAHTRGIRRIGSAAVDMAYVACGRFDGFFEYSLNPWDVAAGCVLITEAGGQLSDFSGGNNYLFGKELVATNTLIYDELMVVVDENFK